jgi:hypothetical protein
MSWWSWWPVKPAKIDWQKEDHGFTESADAAGLARAADTLSQSGAVGLDLEEQQRSGFRYPYSTYPVEYSRHLQILYYNPPVSVEQLAGEAVQAVQKKFQVGQQREEVFQALIDRSRSLLNLQRVKTIFGAKNRPPHRRRHRNPTRWGVVVETPTYDLTVFKVHYGKLTLKIYTKANACSASK